MSDDHVQRLAAEGVAAGDPTGWFERLYAAAATAAVPVPWNREGPRELLVDWAHAHRPPRRGRRAVVVGCGLGADAEYLAGLGYETVAFDVSPSAVRLARARHAGSAVRYSTADLLALPPDWLGTFDLVVESLTVQSMPRWVRRDATAAVGTLVAPGGTLLVIAAVLPEGEDPDTGPPWRLTGADLEGFTTDGLVPEVTEVLTDAEGKLRWRAEYRRPPTSRGAPRG